MLTSKNVDPEKTLRECSNCCKASVQLLPVTEELLEVTSSPSGAPFPEARVANPLRREGERQEQGEGGEMWEGGPMHATTFKMPGWK